MNPITRNFFLGCFPCDSIPHSDRYPYFAVANTDGSFQKGTHWICIYVLNAQHAEYFDSYGELPNPCLERYLNHYKYVRINLIQLQGYLSDSCGHYCIYFSIKRCGGSGFDEIIDSLERKKNSDKFVKNHLLSWTKIPSEIC